MTNKRTKFLWKWSSSDLTTIWLDYKRKPWNQRRGLQLLIFVAIFLNFQIELPNKLLGEEDVTLNNIDSIIVGELINAWPSFHFIWFKPERVGFKSAHAMVFETFLWGYRRRRTLCLYLITSVNNVHTDVVSVSLMEDRCMIVLRVHNERPGSCLISSRSFLCWCMCFPCFSVIYQFCSGRDALDCVQVIAVIWELFASLFLYRMLAAHHRLVQ